jgi:hypothetical protein
VGADDVLLSIEVGDQLELHGGGLHRPIENGAPSSSVVEQFICQRGMVDNFADCFLVIGGVGRDGPYLQELVVLLSETFHPMEGGCLAVEATKDLLDLAHVVELLDFLSHSALVAQ